MKTKLAILGCACFFGTTGAYAVIIDIACPSDYSSTRYDNMGTKSATASCPNRSATCYKSSPGSGKTYVLWSCTTCNTGQSRISNSLQIEGSKNVSYYTCGCTNGCSTTAWTAKSTGYEMRDYCNTTNCTTTKQYRCAVGYYGTSTNGTSGCTRCPASGGVYGTTAAAGSTVITSCYIPSGSSFSDSTGSGTYTGNCYYKN